jgi:hypothetical protein
MGQETWRSFRIARVPHSTLQEQRLFEHSGISLSLKSPTGPCRSVETAFIVRVAARTVRARLALVFLAVGGVYFPVVYCRVTTATCLSTITEFQMKEAMASSALSRRLRPLYSLGWSIERQPWPLARAT